MMKFSVWKQNCKEIVFLSTKMWKHFPYSFAFKLEIWVVHSKFEFQTQSNLIIYDVALDQIFLTFMLIKFLVRTLQKYRKIFFLNCPWKYDKKYS